MARRRIFEVMADPLATLVYPTPSYPYPTGYAQLSDVQARINAGTWDATDPTAFPTEGQVKGWLIEGTATIDAALATRGYYVPLQVSAGWVPPVGMPLYQGIGMGAWMILRHVCAAYAVHFVEASRHGEHSTGQHDENARHWMEIYDDFLTRLESGADALAPFGVGGPFAPDPDPAKGALSGSLGAFLADASLQEGPIFTRGMNLGSGWEQSSPSNAPNLSGTP